MAQGNRDIEQDLTDILATREELTEKIKVLRGRTRTAVASTEYRIVRSLDEVKHTLDGARRIFDPWYYMQRHPLTMMTVLITIGYFLGQGRGHHSQASGTKVHRTRPNQKKTLRRLG